MPAPASTGPAAGSARPGADKRPAIIAAALRLIARSGLHNTPMSALAREAGVAAGTLYLYFPGKEAMINALYLELIEDRRRAPSGDDALMDEAAATPRERLWRSWQALARWYLTHPEATNVIQQCRASGILTEETRAAEQLLDAAGQAKFDAVVARGLVRPMSRQVCDALFHGPIVMLVQRKDAGEFEVDDAVLEATFEGVCRSLLPSPDAPVGEPERQRSGATSPRRSGTPRKGTGRS